VFCPFSRGESPKTSAAAEQRAPRYFANLSRVLALSRAMDCPHNPKVAGSNPAPATNEGRETKGVGRDDRPTPFGRL